MGEKYKIKILGLLVAVCYLLLGKASVGQGTITAINVSGNAYITNAPADECTDNYTSCADICPSGSVPHGTITTLNSYVFGGGTNNEPISIYMMSTASTTFASASTWSTAVSGATLVYSGSVKFNVSGWQTITLTTPFQFTTNNLEVLVLCSENNTGTGCADQPGFEYFNGAVNNDQYWSASSLGALGTSTGNVDAGPDGIQITDIGFPSALGVSAITATSATLSWTAAPAAAPASSGYNIYYSTVNTAPTLATAATASVGAGVTTYAMSGLTCGTTYYVWVRSANASNVCAWVALPSFTTSSCSTLTLGSNIPATANQCPSTSNVVIQGFTLAVTSGNGNLTDISFTTTGSYAAADLTDFKLYYTTTSTFATTNLLATIAAPAVAGLQTFPVFGSPTLTNGQSYWYWITADIAAAPTSGHTIAVNGISTANLTSTSTKAGGPTTAGNTQTLITTPATPGAITGTITQCPTLAGQTYSISAVTNATSYTWSAPAGWTITAGGATTSATITTGATGQNGNITVTATDACGTSAASSQAVTVVATPATPGAITGTASQCPGLTSQTYSVTAVTYATTYTWNVPGGWTITGGSGTNSITVTTGAAGNNGNITVTAGNSCGTSAAQTLAVTVNPGTPATPGAITGTVTQCPGLTSQTYSITAVANATTYTWAVPAGWTITAGAGTTSITVTTGTTGQNGNITVTAGNGCGTSAAQSLAVTVVATPATPGAITGTTPQCPSVTSQTYSISAVTYATTYTWAVPAGWTITAGAGTTSITVTTGATGQNGNITVTAGNSCGTSAAQSLAVTVVATPAMPGALTGTSGQCPSIAGQTYSISAVTYATTYTWSVPAGWTITAGAGTTAITVTTGTTGQNGNITVTAGNSCGTSAAQSLAVTVNPGTPATPGAITGLATQCPSLAGQAYSITAVANATTYTWAVPAGWTITAGAGTTAITVTTGTLGQNGNITVTAGNGCGTSAAQTLAVSTVNTPATPGAITGTTPQCPALTSQTYSVTAVLYATTYTWGVPVGWSITAGAGTNSITVTTGAAGQNGNITVTAGNGCGTSAAQTKAVTVNPGTPATPGAITGTVTQCPSVTSQTYSITAVANATTYTWAVPAGWTITAGAGTTSITVTTGTTGQNGNITVTAGNGCGTSAAQTLAVTVVATPATPGAITGTTPQCPSVTSQTYSISAVTYATTYTWAVPAGWTITAGAGTTSITVTAGTTGQNGNITVTAGNSCGTSAAQTLAVTVVATPATPGAITGTTAQCASVSGQTYSISAVTYATTYTWAVPAGWTITGGSGTTSITVSTGTAGQNGNITVTAGNSCGTSAASSLAVTSATCAPVATASTNADCGSFFANWGAVSGATSYSIDVSTVNTFASFVTGYNSLNVGNCTSYYVSGLSSATGATYYYRIRSNVNATNSNVITALTGNCATSTLTQWLPIGSGAGGINAGDPAHGDYEVAAECTDGKNTLYIGGFFNTLHNASGVSATCIGSWTPNSTYPYTGGTWAALPNNNNTIGGAATAFGGGTAVTNNNTSEIYALVYSNGVLFAGGNFTTINGLSTDDNSNSYNNLAQYNIATGKWTAVGPNNGTHNGGVTGGSMIGQADNYAANTYGGGYPVQALAVDASGYLYVGGNFTTVAGTGGYNNIARWSGASWSTMSGGVTGSNANQNVSFNIPGICDFGNGSDNGGGYNAPSYLGPTSPTVYAIDVVDATHIYAGGQFTTAGGGTTANNIAMWSGSNWSSSSVGSVGIPQCSYYNGACGGTFAHPGTDNGFGWSLCPVVLSIANNGTLVYVGGDFENTGTNTNIALWNQGTSTWSSLVNGGVCGQTNQEAEVTALYVTNGILYVGGDFQSYGSGGSGYNIAAYDGWMDLPATNGGFEGGSSNVLSITSLSSVNNVGGYGIIYAGGDFPATNAGTSVNNIAQYAGTSSGPFVTALPISLIDFNAQYNQSNGVVDLTWTTATEVNNKEFTIEKSIDGFTWDFVTSQPGAGNSTKVLNYAAVDEEPYSGTSYYRLKQTDYDGNYTYSELRPVTIEAELARMTVVPNPARNRATINFNSTVIGTAILNVYDCTGRLVFTKEVNTEKGINSPMLDVASYTAGVYIVAVETSLSHYTAKMVVSK